MAWISAVSEAVKKGTVKYLIQHYLGHFLAKELDMKLLDVDLPNGSGWVSNIQLNEERINTEIAPYLPLKLMEGSVGKIQFKVPYTNILTESCRVDFEGITLNFCKLNKLPCAGGTTTSSSMLSKSLTSSSMEMAEEIVADGKFEVQESVAHLIDSLIRRFKVSLRNTVIKFTLPKKLALSQVVELRIELIHVEEDELNLGPPSPSVDPKAANPNTTPTNDKSKNSKYTALSDVMTKRIHVEGIELRINDVLITKLYGKHTFKIRFDSASSLVDLEAYLGAHIFAILTSDQLGVLRDLLNFETASSGAGDTLGPMANGGRMMSSEDVRQIQEALKNKQKAKNMMTTSTSLARPQWTTSNAIEDSEDDDDGDEEGETRLGGGNSHDETSDEDKFKSFVGTSRDKELKALKELQQRNQSQAYKFRCNLKVPGLMLCIVADDGDEDDDGSGGLGRSVIERMPMMDSFQNFIGINEFLSDILHDYSQIRVMASNVCVELDANEVLNISCLHLTAYEYHEEQLTNIVQVKDVQEEATSDHADDLNGDGGLVGGHASTRLTPSVRIRLKGNLVDIKVAPVVVKLDPTIIERHWRLFKLFIDKSDTKMVHPYHQMQHKTDGTKSSSSALAAPAMMILDDLDDDGRADAEETLDELTINIDCATVEAELHFPIPDLRPDRAEYSQLHDEVLLVKLSDFSFRANASAGDIVCNAVHIDLRCPPPNSKVGDAGGREQVRRLFYAHSDQKPITLHFSTKAELQDEVINTAMMLSQMDSMAESVYMIAPKDEQNTPFQEKCSIIGGEEGVEIVTPGDRAHIGHYLAHNKMTTKAFVYINIPYGDIVLEDKATFELIYNRFVNDLTLWTPYFPKRVPGGGGSATKRTSFSSAGTFDGEVRLQIDPTDGGLFEDGNTSPQAMPILPSFYNCNPAESIDSMTNCDDDESYHTIMDTTITGAAAIRAKTQNEFMIELEIDNLNINFRTQSKRKNNAFLQNFVLGLVVGPESDPSVSLTINGSNVMLKSDDRPVLVTNTYFETNTASELNVAIVIKRESETLKKIKIGAQLNDALLLGIDLPLFDDLFNFVSLVDDPILGYVCPKVVLELYTDLRQCAISFESLTDRPTLLHVMDIYLTSLVIENTDQTILHFVIQDALLGFKRNNVCHETLKNYIIVVDTGIIDLKLTLVPKTGQIELKVYNNEICVKACHDSLVELFVFLNTLGEKIVAQANSLNQTRATDADDDDAGDDYEDDEEDEEDEDVVSQPHKHQHQHCHHHQRQRNEIFMQAKSGGEQLKAEIAEALFEDEDQSMDEKNYDHDDEDDDNAMNSELENSTFDLLENYLGNGINLNTNREPIVRSLIGEHEKLTISEDHFNNNPTKVFPDKTPETVVRYLLDKLSLNVVLFAGHDFDDVPDEKLNEKGDDRRSETSSIKSKTSTLKATRSRYDTTSQANYSVRSGRSTNGTIGGMGTSMMSVSIREPNRVRFQRNSTLWENIDLISNGMYGGESLAAAAAASAGNLSGHGRADKAGTSEVRLSEIRRNNGGSRRKVNTKVALMLTNLRMLVDTFPEDHELAWRFDFRVLDIVLCDEIEGSSINKMLMINGYASQAKVSVLSIRLLCRRNFKDKNEECDLRVALRPLRLNLDQDGLIFLKDFFATTVDLLAAKYTNMPSNATAKEKNFGSRNSSKENIPRDLDDETSTHPTNRRKKRTDSISSSNSSTASPLASRRRRRTSSVSSSSSSNPCCCCCCPGGSSSVNSTTSPKELYIKNFVFTPAVPIRLDYKGKHIDFKQVRRRRCVLCIPLLMKLLLSSTGRHSWHLPGTGPAEPKRAVPESTRKQARPVGLRAGAQLRRQRMGQRYQT